MKTTTKKTETTINPAEARARAAELVADWKAKAEAATEAAATHRATYPNQGFVNQEHTAERLTSDIARMKLEDAATLAKEAAIDALHLAEMAEGDPLAVASDVAGLHADVIAFDAEKARIRAELADVERRAHERVTQAREGREKIAALRASEGLPPPRTVPEASTDGIAFTSLSAALEKRLTDGPRRPQTFADRGLIRQAEREETEIRADLEQRRIEREEEAKRIADRRREEEESRARRAREAAKEHAAQEAKFAADRKRTEDLAEAHRARTAG